MSDNNKSARQARNPILIIGLGGTGKQVMLQMRRQFQDRYGEKTLPFIAHVSIDTDEQNRGLDGEEIDEFHREVLFDDREKINTPIKLSDVKRLYANKGRYQHIFAWFDEELEKHGEITNGAAQIRSFGRLAFFQHYPKIREKLKSTMSSLCDATLVKRCREDYNIELNTDRIDVMIVFSIAGGTGSGMFLDTAHLVKDINPNAIVESMVLLPTAFSEDFSHKIFANSYAALSELEYYTFRSNASENQIANFPIRWTLDDHESGRMGKPPVFQNTWFVDNKAHGDGAGIIRPENKSALTQMMADWLFLRYSDTADSLRKGWESARSNYRGDLSNPAQIRMMPGEEGTDELVEQFARSYSSFGVSKIYAPYRLAGRIAQNRLAKEIVGHWIAPTKLPGDLESRLDQRYSQDLMLENGGQYIFDRLSRVSTTGLTLTEDLIDKIAQHTDNIKEGGMGPEVSAETRSWFDKQFWIETLDISAPSLSARGSLTKYLFDNSVPQLCEDLLARIDKHLDTILNTGGEGFDYAQKALERFAQRYDNIAAAAKSRMSEEEVIRQDCREDANEVMGWVGETKGRAAKVCFEVSVEYLKDTAEAEARRQIWLGVSQTAEKISQHILKGAGPTRPSLMSEVQNLRTNLGNVETRLRKRVESLQKEKESPIDTRVSTDAQEASVYVLQNGDAITKSNLSSLAYMALNGRTVWDTRRNLQGSGEEELLRTTLGYAKTQLTNVEDDSFDILKQLDGKYSSTDGQTDYKSDVSQLLTNGHAWLDTTTHEYGKSDMMGGEVQNTWITRSDTSDMGSRERFEETLKSVSDAPGLQMITGPKDAIYCTTDYVAFPLMAIRNINKYYSDSYARIMDDRRSPRSARVLHLELNQEQFPDLRVVSAQEAAKEQDAYYVLVLGGLLRELEGRLEGDVIHWTRVSSEWFEEKNVRLGSTLATIRKLVRDDTLRQKMLTDFRGRFNTQLADEDYLRLAVLIVQQENAPAVQARGWKPALRRILADISNRKINYKTRASGYAKNRDEWAEEAPKGSGFYRPKNIVGL